MQKYYFVKSKKSFSSSNTYTSDVDFRFSKENKNFKISHSKMRFASLEIFTVK